MHYIAKQSNLGWKRVPFLDEDELEDEDKEDTNLLTTKMVTAAEKAFMTYSIDRQKTANYVKDAVGKMEVFLRRLC